MLKRTIMVSVFLMFCAVLIFAGAKKEADTAKAPGGTVTLRVYAGYGDDDERAMFDYAAAAMQELMPNVKIELEIDPRDDHQRLKTQAATGNLPDVFPLTADIVDLFKKNRSVMPLDSYIDKFAVRNQLTESAAKLLADSDSHVYSIPNQQPTTGLIYINRAMFDANDIPVPQDYDSLLAAVKQFQQKKIAPLGIFASEKWPGISLYDMILTRSEPNGFEKLQSGSIQITNPVFLDTAKKEVELVKAGLVSKNCFAQSYDDVFSQFSSGQIPMFINGSWDLRVVGDKLGDNADILLPNVFADSSDPASNKWAFSGGGGPIPGNAVASTTRYPDIAAEFCIKFSLKMTEARTVKQGTMNMVLKECAAPETAFNSLQQKFASIAGNSTSMSLYAWDIANQKLKVTLEDNCQEILTGQMSAEAFIDNVGKGLR